MFMPPTPQFEGLGELSGRLFPMSNGQAGVFETAGLMRQLINSYKTDIAIRTAAANAIFLQPEKDDYAEVEAIFNWVRDHVRYVRDVNGVETITTPDRTLELMYGDCDDQVILLGAMLESVGYPTRLVISGYSDPRIFEHVYLQVMAHNQWIDLDPTEQIPMGFAPPEPMAYWVEPV